MRGSMICAFLFTVLWSFNARAEDKYVGAIWSVMLKAQESGKYYELCVVRCTTDGKVYSNGKVIGSHKNINLNKVEMKITGAKDPDNNGTWKANRVKKDGGAWDGVYTRMSDGKEFPMALILKRD